ncbi:MAG: cupin domain-containing protein [Terriglobales bacterium]
MLKQIRWDELTKEQLSPKLLRQYFTAGDVTIARFQMKQGLRIATHHHVSEQIMNIQQGVVKVWTDGGEYLLREGDVLCIPPNMPHSSEVLADAVVLDVFSPPRTDWVAGEDAYLRGISTQAAE